MERCPEDGLHLVGEEDHRLSPGDPYLGATLGGRYPILGLAAGDGRPELHYRSRQPLSGREVVLHVFPPAAERTEDHQPLLQAAAAITGLNHPGVVRLLDCGTAQDGTTILVWEQVHSSSLAELFARGGFTCRELVQLAVMVLDALAEAHGKGIPHGDLRPESILLPGGGEPGADVPWIKIRSFGLSKLLRLAGGGQPAVAPAGATAAPEPDCAADLRALSALLRQGLSGQVADGAVGFPAGLLEILERALAPAPETGFASAREMGAALEDLSLGAEADRPLPPVLRLAAAAPDEEFETPVLQSLTPLKGWSRPSPEAFELAETVELPRLIPPRPAPAVDPDLPPRTTLAAAAPAAAAPRSTTDRGVQEEEPEWPTLPLEPEELETLVSPEDWSRLTGRNGLNQLATSSPAGSGRGEALPAAAAGGAASLHEPGSVPPRETADPATAGEAAPATAGETAPATAGETAPATAGEKVPPRAVDEAKGAAGTERPPAPARPPERGSGSDAEEPPAMPRPSNLPLLILAGGALLVVGLLLLFGLSMLRDALELSSATPTTPADGTGSATSSSTGKGSASGSGNASGSGTNEAVARGSGSVAPAGDHQLAGSGPDEKPARPVLDAQQIRALENALARRVNLPPEGGPGAQRLRPERPMTPGTGPAAPLARSEGTTETGGPVAPSAPPQAPAPGPAAAPLAGPGAVPAAPQASQPTKGRFELSCAPADAQLHLLGPAGSTSSSCPWRSGALPPGSYQVELSAEGYQPRLFPLTLAPGQVASHKLQLAPLPARLWIFSSTPNGQVQVDGRPAGTTPSVELMVLPGMYYVTVQFAGQGFWQQQVQVLPRTGAVVRAEPGGP